MYFGFQQLKGQYVFCRMERDIEAIRDWAAKTKGVLWCFCDNKKINIKEMTMKMNIAGKHILKTQEKMNG